MPADPRFIRNFSIIAHVDRLADVVQQERDAAVGEVLPVPGAEVVDREHRGGSVGEAALAQVRAEEPGPSEDDDVLPLHRSVRHGGWL